MIWKKLDGGRETERDMYKRWRGKIIKKKRESGMEGRKNWSGKRVRGGSVGSWGNGG